jgi:outer membrane protein with beta-barrel domain
MRTWKQGWLTLGMLLGLSTTLVAQHPQVRKGFWIGFGPTYGSSGVSCDGCGSTNREDSFGFFLKLGGTLSKNVLLGGEVNSWYKEESSQSVTLGSVAAVVYVYPKATSGLFLKGGVGVSEMFASGGGLPDFDGTGWGLTAGLGYDIRVGKNISITPVANYWFGQPGNIKANGSTVITGWKQNVFEAGLGITFH